VLRAGLTSASWITVDDTGARHKAVNGFCTQIGNAHFVARMERSEMPGQPCLRRPLPRIFAAAQSGPRTTGTHLNFGLRLALNAAMPSR